MTTAPRESPTRRVVRLAITTLGGLFAVAGAISVVLLYSGRWDLDAAMRHEPTPTQSAARERARRTAPLAAIAPAPLPTEIPIRGEVGKRPDGYPTQWVDRAALRSLLHHGKLDDLTRYLEQLEAQFEADPKREYLTIDAFDAFSTADPEVTSLLDAWVAEKGSSFAPWLARGLHRLDVGLASRGGKSAARTHEDDFAAMRDAFGEARKDLLRALEINPRAMPAAKALQNLENAGGSHEAERAANERAFAMCPTCMQTRVAALYNAAPKWGGSPEEMAAIVGSAPVPDNPRLALLPAIIDLVAADVSRRADDLDAALATADRACARGPFATALHDRARIKLAKKDLDGAAKDVSDALALEPGSITLREVRLEIAVQRAAWRDAYPDLVDVLRVDATSATARRVHSSIVRSIVDDAEKQLKAGDRGQALDLFDMAVAIAPGNRRVRARRAEVIAEGEEVTEAVVAAARQAVAAAPGDYRAVQRLDYLLSKTGKFRDVLPLWDAYLRLHPDDGRAYAERSGTHHNLGEHELAIADAVRSCELASSEGCAMVTPLGGKKGLAR